MNPYRRSLSGGGGGGGGVEALALGAFMFETGLEGKLDICVNQLMIRQLYLLALVVYALDNVT